MNKQPKFPNFMFKTYTKVYMALVGVEFNTRIRTNFLHAPIFRVALWPCKTHVFVNVRKITIVQSKKWTAIENFWPYKHKIALSLGNLGHIYSGVLHIGKKQSTERLYP
jgi:hypothetical protein